MKYTEEQRKAIGQFGTNAAATLHVFCLYGLDVHITPVVEHLVKLMLQTHERMNGKDIPIGIKYHNPIDEEMPD